MANSILSDQYAVRNDNWRGLLDRARDWHTTLADQLEGLLQNTGGRKTRAYELLQQTVEPAKQFETTIGPIVQRWDPPPVGQDPYNGNIFIAAAIADFQAAFDPILKQLVSLSDEELLEPARTASWGLSQEVGFRAAVGGGEPSCVTNVVPDPRGTRSVADRRAGRCSNRPASGSLGVAPGVRGRPARYLVAGSDFGTRPAHGGSRRLGSRLLT